MKDLPDKPYEQLFLGQVVIQLSQMKILLTQQVGESTNIDNLGPVVQSIVSLTSSLRG